MTKTLKRLLPLLLGLGIATAIMLLKGIYLGGNAQRVVTILSDSFFAAGVFILGLGLLSLCLKGGACDMLTYSIILLLTNLKFRAKKYENFGDFLKRKGERKLSPNAIISGLILLSLSLILLLAL